MAQGQSGRYFEDWESPAGTIKDYGYGPGHAAIESVSIRGYQVLAGHNGVASMHEYGWHAIHSFYFAGDPPCSTRPVNYLPIGAPRDDGHKRMGDMDDDGISDFAEIYFGTSTDTSNVLSAGFTANGDQQSVGESAMGQVGRYQSARHGRTAVEHESDRLEQRRINGRKSWR